MSKYIESLRVCLKKNQIFFQVSNWIVVGIASIWLSILGCQLNQKKLEMEQSKFKPLFNIKRNYVKNENTQTYDNASIDIENNGESISNFEVEQNSYLVVKAENHTVKIPIIYYGITFSKHEMKGLLATIQGVNNNKLYVNLSHQINDYNLKSNFDKNIELGLRVFLKFTYKDIMKQSGSNCFILEDSFKEIEAVMSECDQSSINATKKFPMELKDVTLQMILDELSQAKTK